MHRSRPRHDRARRRRPPPPVGPGPRRLPVDDRRPRRDPTAVRRRRTSSRCSMRPASTRRSSSRRGPRRPRAASSWRPPRATPRIAGVVGVDGPHEPGRRRRPGRAPRGAGRRTPGRDPPPGPRRAGPRLAAAPGRRGAASPRSSARASSTTCSCGRASCRRRSRPLARCPDLRFVIDHLAKPSVRERAMSPWSERLGLFSALPERRLQAVGPGHRGGLGGLVDGRPPPVRRPGARGLRAGAAAVRLGLAGLAARCALRAGRGRRRETLSGGLSEAERAAVMGGTAVEVYDLPID